ncbi:stalk domain-containing protein [Paenibacillus sp. P22]|uniref:stalk domain-containing protein n=1 Tax=Paenibacillus sp. P22 TaxID=483908 RepID=UPI000410C6C5|nr:GDSL-type esterase/lipase family protein [Paenibacillus sp. P22]CDN44631.1 Copper amine oxidase domain protein [Paenibacillus sp. P22]
MKRIHLSLKGRLAFALAFLLLFGGGAGAAYGAETAAQPDDYHIVALGDSITVGYEPKVEYTVASPPYGYAERLYEQALLHGRASLSNYGIAGLKSSGLKAFVSAIGSGAPITADAIQPSLPDPRTNEFGAAAAKIRQELASADLVAITVGGNDVSALLTSASALSDADLAAQVASLLSEYTGNMTAVLDVLHEINPHASVVIADQYQPLPVIGGKELYAKLTSATDAFTANLDKLAAGYSAKGADVKVAHVAKEFVGREGVLTHMVKDRDFHPTQEGYAVIASTFAAAVWGANIDLAAPAAGSPMNIYAVGKKLDTPYKPVLKKGVNYIAIQDIVQAVGAKTVWDAKTSTANIKYGSLTVGVKIGASTVTVNGVAVPVDSPAYLQQVGKESKTYVPLATVAKGLGFGVTYIAHLKTVFINP